MQYQLEIVVRTSEKVLASFFMKQILRIYFVAEDSPATTSLCILST